MEAPSCIGDNGFAFHIHSSRESDVATGSHYCCYCHCRKHRPTFENDRTGDRVAPGGRSFVWLLRWLGSFLAHVEALAGVREGQKWRTAQIVMRSFCSYETGTARALIPRAFASATMVKAFGLRRAWRRPCSPIGRLA